MDTIEVHPQCPGAARDDQLAKFGRLKVKFFQLIEEIIEVVERELGLKMMHAMRADLDE